MQCIAMHCIHNCTYPVPHTRLSWYVARLPLSRTYRLGFMGMSKNSIQLGGVTHIRPILRRMWLCVANDNAKKVLAVRMRESGRMIPLFVDMGPVHEPANGYAKKQLGVRVRGNPQG